MTPALFIGHGSPMNAIEDNAFSRTWRSLAKSFPRPRGVICVSAHWLTHGIKVASHPSPETIHDFSGFPDELYRIQYAAPGDPASAALIAERLGASLDPVRGLDHGAWGVLCHLYPNADIPVIQVSLDVGRSAHEHIQTGRRLASLREEGMLIVGSGNIVHNLHKLVPLDNAAHEWAEEARVAANTLIQAGDEEGLCDFPQSSPATRLSVPTPDHFWPLLTVMGARKQDEQPRFFNDRVAMGSISMTGVGFGI